MKKNLITFLTRAKDYTLPACSCEVMLSLSILS